MALMALTAHAEMVPEKDIVIKIGRDKTGKTEDGFFLFSSLEGFEMVYVDK